MPSVDVPHSLGYYGTRWQQRTWWDASDVTERQGIPKLTQNHHGVWGVWRSIGSMYRRWDRQAERWEINAPCFVPEVCWRCRYLDEGEYGEYGGDLLAGPICERNVKMPTRTGRCGKMEA